MEKHFNAETKVAILLVPTQSVLYRQSLSFYSSKISKSIRPYDKVTKKECLRLTFKSETMSVVIHRFTCSKLYYSFKTGIFLLLFLEKNKSIYCNNTRH